MSDAVPDTNTSPNPERSARPRLPRLWWGSRRWLLGALVLFGVAHAAIVIGLALMLRRILETPYPGLSVPAACGGLVALAALAYALRTLDAAVAEALGQNYIQALRLRVVRNLQQGAWSSAGHARLGLTMSRLVNDLSSVRNWISKGVARSLSAAATVVGLGVGLLLVNPTLAVTACVMLATGLLAVLVFRSRIAGAVRAARRRRGQLAGFLGEVVDHPITSRRLGRSEVQVRELRRRGTSLRKAQITLALSQALLRFSPDLAHGLGIALLAFLVVTWHPDRSLAAGHVGPGLVLIATLTSAMRDLANAWCQRLAFVEGRRRIRQLLAQTCLDTPGNSEPIPHAGGLPIQIIRLQSPGLGRPVTFSARAGERILLQGPSGSGKSTLARLLARMRDPDEGQVLVGDIPLTQLDEGAAARAIQLVSSDLPLRRGTARENLGFGSPGVSDAAALKAAALCELDHGPNALPDGLDTRISERGVNLSSGQRARLMLARAAALRPGVLVIDEPELLRRPELASVVQRVVDRLRTTTILITEAPPFHDPAFRSWNLAQPDTVVGSVPRRRREDVAAVVG